MTSEDIVTDQQMLAEFLAFCAECLNLMRGFQAAAADSSGYSNADLEEFYGISHNLKGLAPTFGYDLLGQIGTSYCRYIKQRGDDTPPQTELVTAHIKAFDVVITHNITGSAGFRGEQVIGRLNARVDMHVL